MILRQCHSLGMVFDTSWSTKRLGIQVLLFGCLALLSIDQSIVGNDSEWRACRYARTKNDSTKTLPFYYLCPLSIQTEGVKYIVCVLLRSKRMVSKRFWRSSCCSICLYFSCFIVSNINCKTGRENSFSSKNITVRTNFCEKILPTFRGQSQKTKKLN